MRRCAEKFPADKMPIEEEEFSNLHREIVKEIFDEL